MSNSRLTIRLSWIRLSKLIYLIYSLYLGFFQNSFKAIPGLASVLVILLVGVTFLDVNSNRESIFLYANKAIWIWGLFIIYAFLTGICVASNYSLMFNRLFFYASNVAVTICIAVIAKRDGNLSFVMKVWAINGLLLALYLISSGTAIITSTGVFYSAREGSNRNVVAMYLMFGIFGILNLNITSKMKHAFLSIGSIALMTYVIILTASRKGMIGIALLLLIWFFFSFRYIFRTFSSIRKILTMFLVIIVIAFIGYYLATEFKNTYIFERLFNDASRESTEARLAYLNHAIEVFHNNPIVGVGFNQYRVYFGTYAHMNYAEILADTGIIGFVLYYCSYVMMLAKLLRKVLYLRKYKIENSIMALANVAMFLGLFIVILILETAMVAIQDFMMPIAVGVISIVCYSDVFHYSINCKNNKSLSNNQR